MYDDVMIIEIETKIVIFKENGKESISGFS